MVRSVMVRSVVLLGGYEKAGTVDGYCRLLRFERKAEGGPGRVRLLPDFLFFIPCIPNLLLEHAGHS
jgi:hypothetical protein